MNNEEQRDPEELLTVKESCDWLKVSQATFYDKVINAGLIQTKKIEGIRATRIRRGDLDALVSDHQPVPLDVPGMK